MSDEREYQWNLRTAIAECEHKTRVYSGEVFTTAPPLVSYICADCGTKVRHPLYGFDTPREEQQRLDDEFFKMAEAQHKRYKALMEKFYPSR